MTRIHAKDFPAYQCLVKSGTGESVDVLKAHFAIAAKNPETAVAFDFVQRVQGLTEDFMQHHHGIRLTDDEKSKTLQGCFNYYKEIADSNHPDLFRKANLLLADCYLHAKGCEYSAEKATAAANVALGGLNR